MKTLLLTAAVFVLFAVLLRNRVSLGNSIVDRIAKGIAAAEGFYVTSSRAARNHNPGNMTKDLTGKAVGRDGAFVVYANDQDGWENLKKQIRLAFGGSLIYNPSMSILEFAKRYTATEQLAWANNVAGYLGVNVHTKLSELA
jgi:hypothetical protein